MPPLDAYSHNKKLWLIQQHGRYQNKPSSNLRLLEGCVLRWIWQEFGTNLGDVYFGSNDCLEGQRCKIGTSNASAPIVEKKASGNTIPLHKMRKWTTSIKARFQNYKSRIHHYKIM